MKITFVGINYAPDLVGIAPYNERLCDYFVEKGHNLVVITGFPYYPSWKKRKSDRWTWYRKGVDSDRFLIRSYLYVPRNVKVLKRILHELSFTFSAFIPAIFTRKPDLIYVVSPPLSLGLFGVIVSRLRRIPFVFQVNDLVPDTAVILNFLSNRLIIRALYILEKFIFSKASLISVISESIRENLIAKGVPPEKITVRYDFVDINKLQPASSNNPFRKEMNIEDKFVILHSGNMGQKMGLEVVLEVAKKCQNNPVCQNFQFLLVGDGVSRKGLEKKAEELKLQNITFLPLQPVYKLPLMVSSADVTLVVYRKDVVDICFPGKLLTYWACSTPVVAVVDENSETAIQIKMGDSGIITPPEDVDALYQAILKLAGSPKLRKSIGKRGRKTILERFEKYKVLDAFHNQLVKTMEMKK